LGTPKRDKIREQISLKNDEAAMGKDKYQKPGGTGFQPVQSFQISRRNLPHWQLPGSVYFITWRCLPCIKLSPGERHITLEALRYWHGIKWQLYAAVVMPDHVHVLAQPLSQPTGEAVNLSEILHSIKRFSARKINQGRGVQGSLWQDERFDRIVRNEAEFLEKWQYIRNNPVKTGLAAIPEEYLWLYENND
jgi:REP element-mobilizing transposase RayT